MRIVPTLDFVTLLPTKTSLSNFLQMLRKVYTNLALTFNGKIGFGDGTNFDNISGTWANTTAPAAPNTDFTITHNLGRVPVGYWVMQKDRACDVYTGSVAATATQLTLRATVASAVLRLFIVCFLLFFASTVQAQTTTVTLQVTDLGGQAWNFGTWSVVLVSKQGAVPFGPPFNIPGTGPVPNQFQTGSFDGTGTATVIVTPNASIVPTQSQWRFTVCPQATSPCFDQAFVIAGATQSVSPTPPTITVSCSAATKAYSDSEVLCQQGGFYYRLPTNTLRLCTVSVLPNTCTTWIDTGQGAAAAAGSPPQTQVNDPGNPGHFGGTPCQSFPSLTVGPENVDCDWHSKGPNPWLDVTRYGVRGCAPLSPPCGAGITANTTATSTSVTISSASTFVNGDGVVIYGAGPPHSMTTPGAPTVTPSIAQVLTGTRYISNGPTGATTYTYQVFAEDKAGGITSASASGTTTTGAATLGVNGVNVTSCSRANDLVTCTTSSAHGLAQNTSPQMVVLQNQSDLTFQGWYTTTNVADSTHFTFQSAQDTRTGAPISSTGGTMSWWNCNHVSWSAVAGAYRYWIVGRTGGSLVTIGYSWPTNIGGSGTIIDGVLTWDDFGSPMMDHLLLPPWIPSTPPSVATSDSLSATITSGAGTTFLTLSVAAGTSIPGAGIRLDAVPGVLAAATAANQTSLTSSVYFPVAATGLFYVFNSFADLTSLPRVILLVGGNLWLNDTLEVNTLDKIIGTSPPTSASTSSFAYESLPSITVTAAYPGIHNINGVGFRIEGVSIQGNTNGGNNLLVVQDFGGANPGSSYRRVELITGSSFDFNGIGLVARGINGQLSAQLTFDEVLCLPGVPLGSSPLVSATPGILCDDCALLRVKSYQGGHRGIYMGVDQAGGGIQSDQLYFQGSATPAITIAAGVTVGGGVAASQTVFNGQSTMDSTGNPLLWMASASQFTNLYLDHAGATALGTSIVTGIKPNVIRERSPFSGTNGQNVGSTRDISGFDNGCAFDGIFSVISPVRQDPCSFMGLLFTDGMVGVGAPYSIFIDAAPMAAPSVAVAAGGSVPVGTHTYQVSPVWINGGAGRYSYPSAGAVTTPGNQTVNLTWTPTTNCKGYWVTRDGGNGEGTSSFLTGCSVSSFSDTSASATSSPYSIPAGGPTMLLPGFQGMVAPAYVTPSAAGFTSTSTASTLTANRSTTWPDFSGMVVLAGYQNSVYDNFNRANGGLGSNWTTATSTTAPQITGNQVVGVSGTQYAYWSANQFGNDQFSEAVFTTANAAVTSLTVRASGGNSYACSFNGASSAGLYRQASGTVFTAITTGGPGTYASGDIIRLEVVGTTLNCFKNGVLIYTGTDSNYTSGSPGIGLSGGTASLDNWSGGNIHPIAQLDAEQDWTQPQHFIQSVTIGPTNPVAGTLAPGLYSPRYTISGGAAPTCAVTGAGTGATCTLSSFSTDNSGAMQINSGTTPGSSGTWTLTFSAGFPNAAFCTVGPGSGGTVLNARATVFDNTNGTLGVHAGVWDNNAVAINASQAITFIISYVCGGH